MMSTNFAMVLSRLGRPAVANLLGVSILALGLGWAAWIWHSQTAPQDDLSSLGLALSPEDSARYQRDVEVYYGKLGVLAEKWTRQLGALSHGKPLAGLVGIGSIVASAACFVYASKARGSAGAPATRPAGPRPAA